MCRAFPDSDYYGGSAPPRPDRPTTGPAPMTVLAARSGGRTGMVPTFTCRSLVGGGTRLYPCGIAVATPQHFTTAFDSAPDRHHRSSPARHERPGARRLQPISARFGASAALRDVFTPVSGVCLSVSLAGPAPSGSTDTLRLCRGRLPPEPGVPRARLPPASQPCCDRTAAKVSHPHSINKRLVAHAGKSAGPIPGDDVLV
jgi:hypothetical protein